MNFSSMNIESEISFIDINSSSNEDISFLYKVLSCRDETENISHVVMPTYEEHIEFVHSNPYKKWCVVFIDDQRVGSIYLSESNEIGMFTLPEFRDIIKMEETYEEFIQSINVPSKVFINVSPKNENLKRLVRRMGFTHIQDTYAKEIKSDHCC